MTVREDRIVVHDFDTDYSVGFRGDEEFGRAFPDWVRCTFESLRSMNRSVVESDFEEGIDRSTSSIEILSSMNDKSNNSRDCKKSKNVSASIH